MMNMRHNEDRELDIRLAELQADIQIYVAATFGLFAIFAGAAVGFSQAMYTLGTEEINLKITLSVVALMAACASACFAMYCAKKVDETREKIKGLRKQYIW